MTTQTSDGFDRRQTAAKVAPFVMIALAGMAVRTPLAASYPFVALLLFLWIVSDTLMLALLVRSSGKPEWRAVLGVLAGASFTLWLGLPSPSRDLLLETPVLAFIMVLVVLGHVAWATARAGRVLSRPSSDRKEQWVSAVSEMFVARHRR